MIELTAVPTVQHIIHRFVGGEFFIASNGDRDTYLSLLAESLCRTDWKCISYGVMSNHIHLGVIAGSMERDQWLRNAHAPFADWINRRQKRFGAVFVPPATFSVGSEHIADVVAYIHNNPVRAGVAPMASESTWTSHRAYAGLCDPPPWLHVDVGLEVMRKERDAFLQHVKDEAWRGRNTPRRGRPKRRASDPR
jgi:hypothetical protein